VKSYFILGGTMHDVAISSWSIKGYYDFVRPISAIRYMAGLGQSSDSELPNYDPDGLPLIDGYIELVGETDPLVGSKMEHLNKLKLKAWRGPDYIDNPSIDYAGVDWILAENWWPYQRPTFVTPPFAGYVSGHSTYSRAAAEVLTMLTGSEFFPGGMGEFLAPQNEFLVFEEGPSQDVVLQWATYRDASDQCSLSRIWGGIHPSFDDIPGRLIGEKIGIRAFDYSKAIFAGLITAIDSKTRGSIQAYPNPFSYELKIEGINKFLSIQLNDLNGKVIYDYKFPNKPTSEDLAKLKSGVYLLNVYSESGIETLKLFKK
ncbi:MAG: T9SS type A sorting domain-containing protein, partial [Crocinitomicaceae bacterium]